MTIEGSRAGAGKKRNRGGSRGDGSGYDGRTGKRVGGSRGDGVDDEEGSEDGGFRKTKTRFTKNKTLKQNKKGSNLVKTKVASNKKVVSFKKKLKTRSKKTKFQKIVNGGQRRKSKVYTKVIKNKKILSRRNKIKKKGSSSSEKLKTRFQKTRVQKVSGYRKWSKSRRVSTKISKKIVATRRRMKAQSSTLTGLVSKRGSLKGNVTPELNNFLSSFANSSRKQQTRIYSNNNNCFVNVYKKGNYRTRVRSLKKKKRVIKMKRRRKDEEDEFGSEGRTCEEDDWSVLVDLKQGQFFLFSLTLN